MVGTWWKVSLNEPAHYYIISIYLRNTAILRALKRKFVFFTRNQTKINLMMIHVIGVSYFQKREMTLKNLHFFCQ